MRNRPPLLAGIGELLWDLLPGGAHLGGAPANFCYIAEALGADVAMVSGVGQDELGRRAVAAIGSHGIDTANIQTGTHPTGTVEVTLDPDGKPSYHIVESVAWDHVAWTPEVASLATRCDAVCFGTLAQRSPATRATIVKFLEHTRRECLRVFDVNLRPPFYSDELVRASIGRANVVKLNDEELAFVLETCKLPSLSPVEGARALREWGSLRAVCVTRGANGSVIDTASGAVEHPGTPVAVADTVGAGDAFTAAIVVGLLAGNAPSRISDFANRVAGLVASRHGAMPEFGPADRIVLDSTLS